MNNNQFELIIDYDKNEDNPERVFLALAGVVSAFSKFDSLVCDSLAIKIKSRLILESVEHGSVKSVFSQFIECIDDESLKKLDVKGIIGHLLVKGKYKLLDALKEDDSKKEVNIKQLQSDLFEMSKDVNANPLSTNAHIPPIELAKCLDSVNSAFGRLTSKDKVLYMTKTEAIEVAYNSTFSLTYEKSQLIENDITTCNRVMVIIKKPDLLGDSQWELKYDNKSIKARINDTGWLEKFQNREINIRPKDAIECDLRVQSKDIPGMKPEVSYSVEKVYNVVYFQDTEQTKLNFDDHPDIES